MLSHTRTARPHLHPDRHFAQAVLTGAAVVLVALVPSTGAVLADTGQAPSANPHLELREFAFQPAETDVPAGQAVSLTLYNAGVIPHDLQVVGPGMPPAALLNPRESRTIQVQFATPGVYVVMCTIPGHADAGMKGTIVALAQTADASATTGNSAAAAASNTGDTTATDASSAGSDTSASSTTTDSDAAGY